jgi:two-component system phosphate regulon sensor histidine kinase PhoR
VTFRSRLFVTSLGAAAVTLAVATLLMSWSIRRTLGAHIERALVSEARLAAETLSHRRAATREELDAEADLMGRLVDARVTFIAPGGAVVGDSELTLEELHGVENHATRPEILQARREGLGVARRFSTTIDTDMLYVAVPVRNPEAPELSEVRLALPLTAIRDQLAAVRRVALAAVGVALVAALGLAWGMSAMLSRRVRDIAAAAQRYASGDLSQPARDDRADEIGTVARVLDDSARELAVRASELASDRARMQAILGSMFEAVLVVDGQGRLRLANEAARRMLKLADPPEGRHYVELIREPAIAAQIGAALEGRPGEAIELTPPRDPGAVLIARTAPIRSAAGPGAVVVLHDITDLRRADRIRRDFVANVSHELRTPLTAVRGYVEALMDGGGDQAETRRFLETIARHTERMERLVRDLLRLARLDAGQETIERLPCSVASLFDGAAADLDAAIDARRQTVEHDIAPDAQTVQGDPAKLHDALRNLVENATNYAPEGGRIELASRRDGPAILLTVADNGPGIPEQDLARVFERFYRVDKARSRGTRDPGGTGLGLAIVRHLVELHGGRVHAANRPHGGAIFTVELPA